MSEEYSSIRDAAHTMIALAFVPPEDIITHFRTLGTEMPESFQPIYKYFGDTYVRGKTTRVKVGGKCRARTTPPRYRPVLWSQYAAVLTQSARTNNISEGWHNRFQVVMGKDHPSFYAFLAELKKEQADTEIMLRQLHMGQTIRKGQDPKRVKREERIFSI